MASTLPNSELWFEIREKRNLRLIETDWTQMPDSPLSETKKIEFATYRQQLRDLIQEIKKHDNYTNEDKTNPRDMCGDWSFPTKPK
tara:strand:+ start:81 stop:338 length:258 start_codon:yes stop_codon:yes gene_type:complete